MSYESEHQIVILLNKISEVAVACGIADHSQSPFGGPMCLLFLEDIKQSYSEMKHRLEGLDK